MNRYTNDLLATAQNNQIVIERQKQRRTQRRADAALIFAVCAIIVSAYLLSAFVVQLMEHAL